MAKITIFGWLVSQEDIDKDIDGGPFRGDVIHDIFTEEVMDNHVTTPKFSRFRKQVNFKSRKYTYHYWFLTLKDAQNAQLEYAEDKAMFFGRRAEYFDNIIEKIKYPIADRP